jgi:hypothetical protein
MALLRQALTNHPTILMKHDREGTVPMRHDLDLRTNGWGLDIAIVSSTCEQHY